jgi:hypothetical protein
MKLSNRVGRYSGLERLGENGIERYRDRKIGERINNGIGGV